MVSTLKKTVLATLATSAFTSSVLAVDIVAIDGSSTVYPITEAVAEEYRAAQPQVKVTVGVSGTGGGFKKFGRNEIDINDASRSIKDKEIAICEESGEKYELKINTVKKIKWVRKPH